MRIIVLCGGSGSRLADYSLPKPLNMINGVPSIAHCLKNLPEAVTTLHFIAAPHLAKYNFEEIVTNLFKTRKCIVHWIPYFTRGPIESAWLGTSDLPNDDENIVFLDNDVVYNFPNTFLEPKDAAFLGYAKDTTSSEAYSFLTMDDDGFITNYKEKKRISDNFCCGVYGFKNLTQFREVAKAIMNDHIYSELFMSAIYQVFLKHEIRIRGLYFNGDVYHIGSIKELQSSWHKIDKKMMRVCFDLDNTLVTYPTVPGDYRTVRPIHRMIELARKMKADGHTIIIHTARRMETHKHNVGSVIRDIGPVTFQTLSDFDIPCDEILFGKPIADIYIDDRAVNPYRESVESMGYLHPDVVQPLNMLRTNKYNTLCVVNDTIHKKGPTEFLRGEIYFYENIPRDSSIVSYFPKFFGSVKGIDTSQLFIENIKSVPFYTLFKSGLVTELHILQIFEFLDIMHNMPGTVPTQLDMYANYVDKLKKRFSVVEDYPFDDAYEVQKLCLDNLSTYDSTGVSMIHGDLWFSNILVDFTGALKFIDMKGQVNCTTTMGGDRMYDYGKLYQSFLGYDAILYGHTIPDSYRTQMMDIFIREIDKRKVSVTDLQKVTASLIIGTFHSLEESSKQRVWKFVKHIMGLLNS